VREKDIRDSLKKNLHLGFINEPDTLIIDEVGLCQGAARIDILVINNSLYGYEIKSDKDTLDRLQNQERVYSSVLNNVTIVSDNNHIKGIVEIIPEWWGIKEPVEVNGEVELVDIRLPNENPYIDPFLMVQFLWRDEALDILRDLDLAKGVTSKPRNVIWERLAYSLPPENIEALVLSRLKERGNWLSD